MADFNQILDAGDVDGGVINVVIEIPAGSNNKIEWNRKLGVMQLDRVEPQLFAKPTNYGFIPQTLDEDGDETSPRGHEAMRASVEIEIRRAHRKLSWLRFISAMNTSSSVA